MKKNFLALLVILFFVSSTCYSQIRQANTYLQNSYVDKFAGTWVWASGTDTLTLRLAKVRYYYREPVMASRDLILGCHRYVKNGIEVENTLNRYDSIITIAPERRTFYAWNLNDMDTSQIEGIVKDVSKNKRCRIFVEYVQDNTPILYWTLKSLQGLVVVFPGQQYDEGFTLPMNVALRKQP